ncbi:type II toxin-antitoxin system VapC family toxin [Sphingomonas sp. LT1P40]|uniref:type II toxin-antitoxin system VapC family toxin n=1 Tax=Alteristakelama amylovorans TaxID=3096166 RepID=UPI002FCB35FB
MLLDTHTLFWMLRDDRRLSRRAATAIQKADEVLVSAVSGYEICLKYRLGKMPEAAALAEAFEAEVARADCTQLPVKLDHAVAAGKLDLSHRDPFDRLLIAQSLVEGVPLVSNETLFDGYGVERIW